MLRSEFGTKQLSNWGKVKMAKKAKKAAKKVTKKKATKKKAAKKKK